MGGTRGGRRAACAVVAALSLVLLGSGGAAARPTRPGGVDLPDLAVVIAGSTGRTVSVHEGERDFARLERLTTDFDTVTEQVPEAWQEGDLPPVVGTVVWGLTGIGGWPETRRAPGGDTAIERQDQVFYARDGTPWIRTDPAVDVNDDDIRWHRAARADVDVLIRHGMFTAGRVAARPTAEQKVRWALVGLGAGAAAAGAAAVWHVRRRFPREPREPRQELYELER
ncbi:hypothetical protein V2W30_24285 [Streptomyces sp. Q6]|uniref:Uncharacterized protein n=1 Tax=Streptomyces citrinus TaxID=3118173 RepID=A0ACD5AFX1_9ACTN